MSQGAQYAINMADLINIADAACDLDWMKQFYIDQPDKMADLEARVAQLHDIVERAAGRQVAVIYAAEDGHNASN